MDEQEQLNRFIADGSAEAFAALIRENAALVYSAARRQVGDAHLAQDIAQAVFILLARKAARIKGPLAGWLIKATYFAAKDAKRTAARRIFHERRAMELKKDIAPSPQESEPAWEIFAPILDQTLMELSESDRTAITLRYFKGLGLREVGQAQGITEEAARKRVDRALEKLRGAIARHSSAAPPAAALAGLLASRAVEAAPAAVLHSLLATGASAAAETFASALATSTAKLMTTMKLKLALAFTVATFFALTGAAAWMNLRPAAEAASVAAEAAAPMPVAPASTITLKPGESYKGWVHIAVGDEKEPSIHFNTLTVSSAGQSRDTNSPFLRARNNALTITFNDSTTGETFEYLQSTGLIRRGFTRPEPPYPFSPGLEPPLATIVTCSELLDKLHALGKDAVTIAKSSEHGLDRYDITLAESAIIPENTFFGTVVNHSRPPSSVWVDPRTNLICRAVFNGKSETYTYGSPEITSIYDAGAPRDAKVYDNRPSPEALAVVKRIMARAKRPFPDGLMVRLIIDNTSRASAELFLYSQSGVQWSARDYPATLTGPEDDKVLLPDHWQDSVTDELFSRLAAATFFFACGGDNKTTWRGDFNKETGELVHSTFVEGADGKRKEVLVPGVRKFTGLLAEMVHYDEYWLMQNLYPSVAIEAPWTLAQHLDLITAPDRPGQIGLRTRSYGDTPDELHRTTVEWIDPEHDDRFVSTTILIDEHLDPNAHGGVPGSKLVTQYGDYATFPAPDGRSYPTTWTQTSSTPQADGTMITKVTLRNDLHFFPGKLMPDLPKMPATMPTTSP